MVIIASCSFLLTSHREVAYTLHITDYTSQIINIFTLAMRTFLKVVLADISALVAYRIRNIEREVVAPFLSCYSEELGILRL
jgi:hypothetical protein